jgi:hypothetical protein
MKMRDCSLTRQGSSASTADLDAAQIDQRPKSDWKRAISVLFIAICIFISMFSQVEFQSLSKTDLVSLEKTTTQPSEGDNDFLEYVKELLDCKSSKECKLKLTDVVESARNNKDVASQNGTKNFAANNSSVDDVLSESKLMSKTATAESGQTSEDIALKRQFEKSVLNYTKKVALARSKLPSPLYPPAVVSTEILTPMLDSAKPKPEWTASDYFPGPSVKCVRVEYLLFAIAHELSISLQT